LPQQGLKKVVEKSVALLYFQFTSTLAREQLQYFGFQQRSSLVLAGIVEHLSALVVIQPWKIKNGATATDALVDCFLTDLDIRDAPSVCGGIPPHHRSPTSAAQPAGQDL